MWEHPPKIGSSQGPGGILGRRGIGELGPELVDYVVGSVACESGQVHPGHPWLCFILGGRLGLGSSRIYLDSIRRLPLELKLEG